MWNLVGDTGIDAAVGLLTDSLQAAIALAYKPMARRVRDRPPKWDPYIAQARRNCCWLFNVAKHRVIGGNRFNAWRNFCSGVEVSSETIRLRKIMSLGPVVQTYIQKSDGFRTMNSQETHEALFNTHFSGNSQGSLRYHGCVSVPIYSFFPYKSPGLDRMILVVDV